MKSQAELVSFFDGELKGVLDKLEQDRKTLATKFIFCGLGTFILAAAAYFLFQNVFAPVVGVIIGVIITFFLTSSQFKDYNKN